MRISCKCQYSDWFLPTSDENAGIDPFSNFNQIWPNKTFGNWSRDLDLSCVTGPNAKYKKVWIVGTSETRHLFEHLCFSIHNTTEVKPIDKFIGFSQCQNFYFVNMCYEGGQCGCDFIPILLNNYESDLSTNSSVLHAACMRSIFRMLSFGRLSFYK